MHAGVQSEIRPQYEVLTISTPAGISVREYLNRDGIVFAVNWSGPVPADLQQLLGASLCNLRCSRWLRLRHPGIHRSLRLESSGLIVELGGHLRAYSGRAYLAALIPRGCDRDEFR